VVALDSDWGEFGGYNRVDRGTVFASQDMAWNDRPFSLQVYTPSRTLLVLKLKGT
jgi:1,4-alpha-glucan branching enzyme